MSNTVSRAPVVGGTRRDYSTFLAKADPCEGGPFAGATAGAVVLACTPLRRLSDDAFRRRSLNAVIIAAGVAEVITTPGAFATWVDALTTGGGVIGDFVGPAVVAFPLLVLGLSGFETGVSMMPLIAADGADEQQRLAARIRNTRKLLTAAAAIMSVYLLAASFVTTVLIPAEAFADGGEANGRALAYLAHEQLGEGIGTAYDISTILILWFAGASAMAGLVNIVPRYLPGYGMAPEWAGPCGLSSWSTPSSACLSRSRSTPTSTPRPARTPPASWR